MKKGRFVVSLSIRIDSTLCLGLLRKTFPEEKIVAECGIFVTKEMKTRTLL